LVRTDEKLRGLISTLVKNEAEIQMSRARSTSQNSKLKMKKNPSRNELMPRTNSQPQQQISQRRGARPT